MPRRVGGRVVDRSRYECREWHVSGATSTRSPVPGSGGAHGRIQRDAKRNVPLSRVRPSGHGRDGGGPGVDRDSMQLLQHAAGSRVARCGLDPIQGAGLGAARRAVGSAGVGAGVDAGASRGEWKPRSNGIVAFFVRVAGGRGGGRGRRGRREKPHRGGRRGRGGCAETFVAKAEGYPVKAHDIRILGSRCGTFCAGISRSRRSARLGALRVSAVKVGSAASALTLCSAASALTLFSAPSPTRRRNG